MLLKYLLKDTAELSNLPKGFLQIEEWNGLSFQVSAINHS